MLVSIIATVFALAAVSAARPGASVLKARAGMTGPSEAYEIREAQPDQSFNLDGSSGNPGESSSSTETAMSTDSASSTETAMSTDFGSSTETAMSTDSDFSSSGTSLSSGFPSPTGALSLTSALSSLNTSILAGGAASTSGFKIGFMKARHAENTEGLDDIFTSLRNPRTRDLEEILKSLEDRKTRNVADMVTSLEARQMSPISTSMPSATSSSSTTSSLLSLPSVTSASSDTSSLLSLTSLFSATSTGSSTASASSPSVTKEGGIAFEFRISQDAGNTNNVDLVVAFTNLPCGKSPGPFSFEFNFVPNAGYSSTGEGQINVFKVNGNLGNRPTYNTVAAATGSLIGTFELPTGSDATQPKLIFINQLVCEPTINLRFGITQYSSSAGAVAYFNQNGMGLRERSG